MQERAMRRRFSVRGLTSLVLTLSFLLMVVSGVVLYGLPRGYRGGQEEAAMWGLDGRDWAAVHITESLLFTVAAVVHVVLNWKVFWGYIHRKAGGGLNLKWELLIAVVLVAALAVATVYRVWPVSGLLQRGGRGGSGRQGIGQQGEGRRGAGGQGFQRGSGAGGRGGGRGRSAEPAQDNILP